jgi:Undecaprenyl-phosphate glucose phosphotransferase
MASISGISPPISRNTPITDQSIGLQLAVLEFVSIIVSSITAQASYTRVMWGEVKDLDVAVGVGIVIAALFVATAHALGLYRSSRVMKYDRALGEAIGVWILAFLIAAMAAFLLKVGDHFSRGVTIILFLLGLGTLALVRILMSSATRAGISFGRVRQRRAALFFDPDFETEDFLTSLKEHGYRVVRCIPLGKKKQSAATLDAPSPVNEIIELVRSNQLDEAVVLAPLPTRGDLEELMTHFRRVPLPVRLIAGPEIQSFLERPIFDYGEVKAFELQRAPLSGFESAVKRTLDVLLAGATLLCLWPLLVIIAIAIKLDSPGPFIFAQKRVGFNGRTFRMLKFRSMHTLDDGPVVQQAQRGDARVTSVGRWIRSTSLDELPQLFNVLKGDMSLVGPRPHVIAHDSEYGTLIDSYAMRLHMKPGITGLAQVVGYRGETAIPELMARRVNYDLYYIANWSLWLDFAILLRTAVIVLSNKSKVY